MKSARPVIIVSGKIASGKTTFAHALASALDMKVASLGDEIRDITRRRGLPQIRESWQSVGEDTVQNGAKEFCEAVLRRCDYVPGEGVVLEGLRHEKILRLLRAMTACSRMVHIHVTSTEDIRGTRRRKRGVAGDAEPSIEAHPAESQLTYILPAFADLVVDGSLSTEEMVRQTKAYLGAFLAPNQIGP